MFHTSKYTMKLPQGEKRTKNYTGKLPVSGNAAKAVKKPRPIHSSQFPLAFSQSERIVLIFPALLFLLLSDEIHV